MKVINLKRRLARLDPDSGKDAMVYFVETESSAPAEFRRGIDTVWRHGNWNPDRCLTMPRPEFQSKLRKLMKEINGKTRSVTPK